MGTLGGFFGFGSDSGSEKGEGEEIQAEKLLCREL